MSSADASMTLKLLICSRNNTVLFAEAGKDFVDFIFSLLTLPLGTVINLISAESMVGSIGRLYESVEKLSETYLQPEPSKSSLLQPKIASSSSSINAGASAPLILAGVSVEPPPVELSDFKYYTCSSHPFHNSCTKYVTTTVGFNCPYCRNSMDKRLSYLPAQPENLLASTSVNNESDDEEEESGGFVRGVVTYMVMDDLEVIPMSAISSITLINKFGMKNGGSLPEEKTVFVGMHEALALLQTAFKSKTILTDVFLEKKKINPT